MKSSRTIHLRRPPVLSVQEGVFVPAGPRNILDDVNRMWEALCADNPAYFDGRLYHVLGVHRNGHGGCTLHVIDCAYRFLAAQNAGMDLGVRGLGVKGVVERGGLYLMGRRSMSVCAYPGLWEFAPSGGVEPGIEPARTIQNELLEETGMRSAGEPVPIAVMFDPMLKCWELVYRLSVKDAAPIQRTNEYTSLEWRRPEEWPADLSPIAHLIAQLLTADATHHRA